MDKNLAFGDVVFVPLPVQQQQQLHQQQQLKQHQGLATVTYVVEKRQKIFNYITLAKSARTNLKIKMGTFKKVMDALQHKYITYPFTLTKSTNWCQ